MGTRSDLEGYRYKPRQTKWESNLELKQEFENIGNSFGNILRELGKDIGGLEDTVSALSNRPTDTDVLVKINNNDNIAGMLQQKLIAGAGVTFTISDTPSNGLTMIVSVNPDLGIKVIAKDFNTHKYVGEAERLQFSFDHDINNEFYLFDIYRPLEKFDSTGVATDSAGEERGRFQIRWKSVRTKANRFEVNFHQPEFGTVILIGSNTVQRG
jgi:hypothetical protein